MEECVRWKGRIDRDGYGRDGSGRGAHCLAYEATYGPIPKGLIVHHECENPSCVNAAHLVALTRAEHNKVHHEKEQCGRGHPFDEANTYIRPKSYMERTKGAARRSCRKCHTEASARYRSRLCAA
jgi:hypothetical protein